MTYRPWLGGAREPGALAPGELIASAGLAQICDLAQRSD
jgi:hypothetical protein